MRSCAARVPPHPGQSRPVASLNGQIVGPPVGSTMPTTAQPTDEQRARDDRREQRPGAHG